MASPGLWPKSSILLPFFSFFCERGEIVHGDGGPVGGVAQVVCHGVKVVGVHREEGQEEEGEKQGEVEREVVQLRDNRTCAWREDGMTDSRDLEPSGM